MAHRYRTLRVLGSGTSGTVYEALDDGTGKKYAIKIINSTVNGVDHTSIREVKFLRKLRGENLIEMQDIYVDRGALYLVMELCPYSLADLIYDSSIVISPSHIKSIMKMLLNGVNFCHQNYVLHRDLKPGNLLFTSDGILKVSDFGLARCFGSPRPMTWQVMTSPYRPPELLFGARYYSTSADIWSVGCIFAEMMLRYFFLFGDPNDVSPQRQLNVIFNVFGTPTPENWPGVEELPGYVKFVERSPLNLVELFSPHIYQQQLRAQEAAANAIASSGSSSEAVATASEIVSHEVELLKQLMTLNPATRLEAKEALNHSYFQLAPLPCLPSELPKASQLLQTS